MYAFSVGFISRNVTLGSVVVRNILRHQRCLLNGVISTNNHLMRGRLGSQPSVSCSLRFFHTSYCAATKLAHKPRDHMIKAHEIFLIDEHGSKVGKIALRKALILGKEKNLYVVQLYAKMKGENIPICKLMSLEAINADTQNVPTKSRDPNVKRKMMMFSSEITDHDISHKMRSMVKHLQSGHHVAITVKSNKPKKARQEDRVAMFNKIVGLVADHGTVDGKVHVVKGQVSGIVKPVEKPS